MSGMWPLIGPRAGGTEVTITGHELDTGNDVHVLLDHVPCHFDRYETIRYDTIIINYLFDKRIKTTDVVIKYRVIMKQTYQ